MLHSSSFSTNWPSPLRKNADQHPFDEQPSWQKPLHHHHGKATKTTTKSVKGLMTEVFTLFEGLLPEVRQAMANPTRSPVWFTSTQTTHTGSAAPPLVTISLGKTSAYGSTHDIKRTGQDLQVGEGILRLASIMMTGRALIHTHTARNLTTTWPHLTDRQAAHRLCLLFVASTKATVYYEKQELNEFLQLSPEFKYGHQPRHKADQTVSKTGVLQLAGTKQGRERKAKRWKSPHWTKFYDTGQRVKKLWASRLVPEVYLDQSFQPFPN